MPAPLAGLVAACLGKDPARPDLEQVLAHPATPASPGTGPRQGRWLPEALTQVITERRTLALTAVAYPATGYQIAVHVLLAARPFALVSVSAEIPQGLTALCLSCSH
ncbi:hypothetical protein [Nonomuraea polychroma]|uniref:hypothetical protein n=1 Tax=Nonomuraea polychroma TaxID=46176 RepID=UPI001F4EE5BA|nr:hypothetical protein [Nonomuraea polychroma]